MARGNMAQGLLLALWQLTIIILFFLFVDYEGPYHEATGEGKHNNIGQYYLAYSHVATMALVGFGYLMTFLRRYRFGAIGYTFLVTVLIFQWSILTLGFWERVQSGKWNEKIKMSVALCVDAMFAACSCLIALGGMIGKVSIWQFLFLSFWQTIFYSANYILGSKTLKVVDIGGSMYIHLFGAYWGLAATFMMNPSNVRAKLPYKSQGASYSSDTFSMIGTLFLWLFWPSFNGALALHDVQARVFLNTILSLTGSCMITFAMSVILRHDGKFCMEDIQNATLAGGVAIGASADLYVTPGGALMVGVFSGIISTFGFAKLSPFILKHLGLHDSCGIHNLHGMTGFLGAIVSAIVTGIATPQVYGPIFDELLPRGASGDQWKYQLACLGHSLAISVVGGLIFGFITDKLKGMCQPHEQDAFMFDDRHAFEVPEPHNESKDIEMSKNPHD